MSGLSDEREEEIINTLSNRFSAQAPLHKVKGRARESDEGSSSKIEPESLSGSFNEVEVKVKRKVKVKVNLDAIAESPDERRQRLHKVMRESFGNIPPQYPKNGITIFRPIDYLGKGLELGQRFDNHVFHVEIFKFAMDQTGRWNPGEYALELQKGALQAIEKVCEEFIGEEPKYLALWRYGRRDFPVWFAAEIPEQDANPFSEMLESEIIESIPSFKKRSEEREYRRKHRTKAGNRPSTPPRSGSKG